MRNEIGGNVSRARVSWGLILVLATCMLLGCGGGGGRSPSETPRPSGRLLIITILLGNPQLSRTIQEANIALDGRVVNSFSSASPSDNAIMIGQVEGVSSGQHTLTLTVVRQTRSPTTYQLIASDVSVFDSAGHPVSTIRLDRTVTLTTGRGLDIALAIP